MYMVTCNFNADHREEFKTLHEAKGWADSHAQGYDPDFQEKGHDEFRVWLLARAIDFERKIRITEIVPE
jgi:hypothetical protein